MPALPPEEVRRLGDRRRRRQYAGAALASLVVVGVVGGGGLWLQGLPASQERSGPADTSRTLATEVRTDLPGDFPLSAGLEVIGGETEERQLYDTTLTLCDELVGLAETDGVRADRSLAVGGEGESAAYTRSLAVFDDVEQATAFVDGFEEVAGGCDSSGEATLELVPIDPAATGIADLDVRPAQALDLRSYDGSAASSYRVYRVANAVLVSTTDDPFGGSDALEALTLDGAQLDLPVLTAMQYYAGRDLPSYSGADPGPDPDTGEGTAVPDPGRPTYPAQLLTVDDLPLTDAFAAWNEEELSDDPTLACAPDSLSVLRATSLRFAEFSAPFVASNGLDREPATVGLRDAAVDSAVLAFDSPDAAADATEVLTGWIRDCAAPSGGEVVTPEPAEPALVLPDGADGTWYGWSYEDPDYVDFCTDASGSAAGCDATRFDYQGVVQAGSYVVLVSYSEIGTPDAPPAMAGRMDTLLGTATARAAYGIGG